MRVINLGTLVRINISLTSRTWKITYLSQNLCFFFYKCLSREKNLTSGLQHEPRRNVTDVAFYHNDRSSFHFEVNCETTLVTIEINGLCDGRWKRNVNVMEVEFVVVLFWCWAHVQSCRWKGGCRDVGGYGSGGKALQTLRVGSVYRLLKESNRAQSFPANFCADAAHMFTWRSFSACDNFLESYYSTLHFAEFTRIHNKPKIISF